MVFDSPEPAAAAALCFPGQPVAFSFFVGREELMFPGALADHVLATGGGVWMVKYEDGDTEAVRAEHVPAGMAEYQRYFGGASPEEAEQQGAAGADDGAPVISAVVELSLRSGHIQCTHALAGTAEQRRFIEGGACQGIVQRESGGDDGSPMPPLVYDMRMRRLARQSRHTATTSVCSTALQARRLSRGSLAVTTPVCLLL